MTPFRPSRWGMRLAKVTRVAAFAVAATALLSPGEATAHGGGGEDATNYRSTVDDPGHPGLEWTIIGGDVTLRLTNRTGEQVTILGYEGEPYLRFIPGQGVFENLNSPATYQNQDRYAVIDVPDRAKADAEADWARVTTGDAYGWHDHRIHWMSNTLPPMVSIDPAVERTVMIWSVPVVVGTAADQTVAVAGRLAWVPSVPWWPPVVATSIVVVAVALAAAWRTRPQGRRWVGLGRPVTVIVWIVLALNLVRLVDDMVASGATLRENAVLAALLLPMMLAIAALTSRSWRGHPGGFGALALAGLLVMIVFGGENWSQLSAPLLVTELPMWVRRWTIAASLSAMLATSVAALLAIRWWWERLR